MSIFHILLAVLHLLCSDVNCERLSTRGALGHTVGNPDKYPSDGAARTEQWRCESEHELTNYYKQKCHLIRGVDRNVGNYIAELDDFGVNIFTHSGTGVKDN